jgi:hypothetical protein
MRAMVIGYPAGRLERTDDDVRSTRVAGGGPLCPILQQGRAAGRQIRRSRRVRTPVVGTRRRHAHRRASYIRFGN